MLMHEKLSLATEFAVPIRIRVAPHGRFHEGPIKTLKRGKVVELLRQGGDRVAIDDHEAPRHSQ